MLRATRVSLEFGWVFTYGAVTLCGRTFQSCSFNLSRQLFFPTSNPILRPNSRDGKWWPHNPNRQADWFRLFRVRSPLLAESLRFLFLRLLRCFSSPGYLHTAYVFSYGLLDITPTGFLHSGISGSTLLCSSPERFAAFAPFIGNLSLGIRRTPSLAC